VLVYRRSTPSRQALVALNFSNRPQQITLPSLEIENQTWQLLFGGNGPAAPELDSGSLCLPPYGTAILLS